MKIEGLTIAVNNMNEMLKFYSSIFDLEFEELEMFDSKLYNAYWGEISILFCPAEIAQVSAKQNRHQFDIIVDDLAKTIDTARQCGGSPLGKIFEGIDSLSVRINDPDENSIVFKQYK